MGKGYIGNEPLGMPLNPSDVPSTFYAAYLRGHLHGLTLANNVSDATNDIDIAVGIANTDAFSDMMTLSGALTKQLDATWAVGTNQGMRASGAAIANTTYFIFLIKRTDTGVVDVAADTSATGANITANTNAAYTYKRRIGAIIRSAGAILPFVQNSDYFNLGTPVLDFNGAGSGSARSLTCTVPIGIKVQAFFNIDINGGASGAQTVYLSDLATADLAAASAAAPLGQVIHSFVDAGQTQGGYGGGVWTNTSGQIRHRELNGETARIATLGWLDYRGKDA